MDRVSVRVGVRCARGLFHRSVGRTSSFVSYVRSSIRLLTWHTTPSLKPHAGLWSKPVFFTSLFPKIRSHPLLELTPATALCIAVTHLWAETGPPTQRRATQTVCRTVSAPGAGSWPPKSHNCLVAYWQAEHRTARRACPTRRRAWRRFFGCVVAIRAMSRAARWLAPLRRQ